MTTDEHPAPRPIPAPADFPITWDDPSAAHLPWMQDRQHAPEPITAMTGALGERFARGFSKALTGYDQPMGARFARVNSYYYMSIAPVVPPEQMHAAEPAAKAGVERALGMFAKAWDEEWLPEVRSHVVASVPLTTAPLLPRSASSGC